MPRVTAEHGQGVRDRIVALAGEAAPALGHDPTVQVSGPLEVVVSDDTLQDLTVVIREAQDDNPSRLRRWQELGLIPGAKVRIVDYQPLDDLFEVKIGGKTIQMGRDGFSGLFGEGTK